ncbi:replicative DNA helicase [compost metagenome]
MASAYDFSETFQEKILALLWRDSTFFTLYEEVIKPQYFEMDIHIDLARIIVQFYNKYNLSPSLEAMMEEIRVLCGSSKVKKEKLKDYLKCVETTMNMNLDDMEYVRDKVVQFGQKQALTEAILGSVEDVQKGTNFDRVKQRIDEASQVGQNIGELGTFYFHNLAERIPTYYSRRDEEKIPTGIDLLDVAMHGGLGRGELGIVIAPPGTGKTLSLINFGHAAILKGLNVAHYSFEMHENLVTARYDMRFVEKDFSYIKENTSKVVASLTALSKMKRGELVVKSFPTRTATISMIKSHLTKLKIAKGFIPDLIILDYPDIMKPSREYGEKRTELELMYEEIRALGQEFNCAVWGASQTNRGALSKKVVTIADLAESFGKAAVADFMIAISQTKEEKRNGEVRYYIAKHRNGQSDQTVHCDIWYETMKIQSNAERETSFDLEDDNDDEEDRKAKWAKKKKQMDEQRSKSADEAENDVSNAILNKMKGGA